MRLLKESRLMLMNLLSSFPFGLLPVWNPGEYRRASIQIPGQKRTWQNITTEPPEKQKKTAQASTSGNIILITRVTCLCTKKEEENISAKRMLMNAISILPRLLLFFLFYDGNETAGECVACRADDITRRDWPAKIGPIISIGFKHFCILFFFPFSIG